MADRQTLINQNFRQFMVIGNGILLLALLAVSGIAYVSGLEKIMTEGFIAFLYTASLHSLVCIVWRLVIASSPDYMPQFFMGMSGLRFLSVLALLGGTYAVVGADEMVTYAMVFLIFYLIMLTFQSVLFSRISNKLL